MVHGSGLLGLVGISRGADEFDLDGAGAFCHEHGGVWSWAESLVIESVVWDAAREGGVWRVASNSPGLVDELVGCFENLVNGGQVFTAV
jgi:hypothetical protein